MKAYGGVKIKLHSFIISVINGGEWLTSGTGRFTAGKGAPAAPG
jgi:hypothetical protein